MDAEDIYNLDTPEKIAMVERGENLDILLLDLDEQIALMVLARDDFKPSPFDFSDATLGEVAVTFGHIAEATWQAKQALAKAGLYHEALLFDPDEDVAQAVLDHEGFNIKTIKADQVMVEGAVDNVRIAFAKEGLFHEVFIFDENEKVLDAVVSVQGWESVLCKIDRADLDSLETSSHEGLSSAVKKELANRESSLQNLHGFSPC